MSKFFFAFAGQGAQNVGMGADLYEHSNAAKVLFDSADQFLGFELSKIIFYGPETELTRTKYCQLAIYTMSCAALAAFKEKYPEIIPIACGGLSLGEYSALYAAGACKFEQGLTLLARRAELMDEACQLTNGGMASVLNGDPQLIAQVCSECGVDVANYNSPGQIVISGEKESLAKAVEALKAQGIRKVIVLNVSGAFHSHLMSTAAEALIPQLEATEFIMPAIPVYHNFSANTAKSVGELRCLLSKQVSGSVRWEECLRQAVAAGAEGMIEFGPGNVLTKLAVRTIKDFPVFNVNSFESINGLNF